MIKKKKLTDTESDDQPPLKISSKPVRAPPTLQNVPLPSKIEALKIKKREQKHAVKVTKNSEKLTSSRNLLLKKLRPTSELTNLKSKPSRSSKLPVPK